MSLEDKQRSSCNVGTGSRYGLSVYGWSFQRTGEHFVNCVLEQEKPGTPGTKALQKLKLIEAIFRENDSYNGRSSYDGSESRTEVTG